MKYCIKCLRNINDKKESYVMFIVKSGIKIKEFKCFHISCWKKHFEDVLKEYEEGRGIW